MSTARSLARAPFFRHHRAEQGPACKYRVAELAALRLLAESGLIDIPPPRRQAVHVGPSGRVYSAQCVGDAIQEAVVERRLISAVQAELTLSSGRQVALVLRGRQDIGELGSLYAVIEVHVDDPEVALLAPNEILARSELRTGWLHLVKHADDERVQRLADDAARAQALDALDIDPADLELPVGATKKQASETLLHWAVKDALLQLGTLRAPEFRDRAVAVGKDGDLHTVDVCVPPTVLEVADVADEVLFDGYRPDILCSATARSGELGHFRLLVEVVVTSKVTVDKLRLIQRDDVACIELEVGRFSEGGRVSRPQLRELVRSDLACKAWLHHPHINRLLALAQAKANQARDEADRMKAIAEQQRLAHRRREEERLRTEALRTAGKLDWARQLSKDQALQELRLVLERRWAAELVITSNGMTWFDGEFESTVQQILAPIRLDRLVTAYRGVAWRLSEILRVVRGEHQLLDLGAVVSSGDGLMRWDLEAWLGLVHLAIDHFKPEIDPEQLGDYAQQRQAVIASLQAGQDIHARPGDHDEVLAGLFPELRPVLEQELGTLHYCRRIELERAAAAARSRVVQQAAEEAAAAAEALRKAEVHAERERERLRDAIGRVCYQMAWRTNLKVPRSADEAVLFLRFSSYKDPGQRTAALVADGWQARASGRSFKEWFSGREYDSIEAVGAGRGVLEAAFLIEFRRE